MHDEIIRSGRLRRGAFVIVSATFVIAAIIAAVLGLGWEFSGFSLIALLGAFPLLMGLVIPLPARLAGFADGLSVGGLMFVVTFTGGTIAIMSARTPMPIADDWLRAMDSMIGLSANGFVAVVVNAPPALIELLLRAYQAPIQLIALSLVILPLIGRRLALWRLGFLYCATLLVTSIIGFVAPAYGSFTTLDPDVAALLPGKAGTYFWHALTQFRVADHPTLSSDVLAGVVCFPSFHTISALLLAQAWRGVKIAGSLIAAISAMTIIATLPMGGHYFIDLIAAVVVWAACTMVANRVEQGSYARPGAPRLLDGHHRPVSTSRVHVKERAT